MAEGLETYVIRGGREGRERLSVISRVLAPSTSLLLDRLGPLDGAHIIDAGCGGGDVTFDLARRAGPTGVVVGLDLDAAKLAIAADEATSRGSSQIRFESADLLKPWPVASAKLVYARFVLTHMSDPGLFLSHAKNALQSGGIVVLEDIDYAGRFWDPPSATLERVDELYIKATQARGGDPFIGRRLHTLLERAGFHEIETGLVQPYGRHSDIKETFSLTHAAIADGVVASGLATRDEVDRLAADLTAYAARRDTMMSFPRIFQAWGKRPE